MKYHDINFAYPKLDKRLTSYQYLLSNSILGARIRRKLTKKQAANKVKLSLNDYLGFERGTNWKATKNDYNEILRKLRS